MRIRRAISNNIAGSRRDPPQGRTRSGWRNWRSLARGSRQAPYEVARTSARQQCSAVHRLAELALQDWKSATSSTKPSAPRSPSPTDRPLRRPTISTFERDCPSGCRPHKRNTQNPRATKPGQGSSNRSSVPNLAANSKASLEPPDRPCYATLRREQGRRTFSEPCVSLTGTLPKIAYTLVAVLHSNCFHTSVVQYAKIDSSITLAHATLSFVHLYSTIRKFASILTTLSYIRSNNSGLGDFR